MMKKIMLNIVVGLVAVAMLAPSSFAGKKKAEKEIAAGILGTIGMNVAYEALDAEMNESLDDVPLADQLACFGAAALGEKLVMETNDTGDIDNRKLKKLFCEVCLVNGDVAGAYLVGGLAKGLLKKGAELTLAESLKKAIEVEGIQQGAISEDGLAGSILNCKKK